MLSCFLQDWHRQEYVPWTNSSTKGLQWTGPRCC